MQQRVSASDGSRGEAFAFLAELIRLQRQISDVSQQVDRLETEMQQLLSELGRERFEEYR